MHRLLLATASIAGLATAYAAPASATLHGFCDGTTPACTDNGTNTPTSTNPPSFGFTTSPGPQTGDYRIEVLVPNNQDPTPSALSFSITGTQGGAANDSAISATASLFSTTAWITGQLDAYLGLGASPTNPIGAYLPSTQALDAGATGFYVYQADLGINQVQPNGSASAGPLLNISPGFPAGSYLVGFLLENPDTNTPWEATANSGAIFETGPYTHEGNTVPEPASLTVLGMGLIGLQLMRRRKAAAAA